MAGEAVVRAAVPGGGARICEICAEAYRVTCRGLPSAASIERTTGEFYNEPRVSREVEPAPPHWFGYRVVEEGGVVLGAAGGGMTGDRAGELFVLYLDPEQRNRGLGTLLLDDVTAQLREAGADQMWVAANPGNERALPFYRARGFREIETVRAYGSQDGDGVQSVRLRRAIG